MTAMQGRLGIMGGRFTLSLGKAGSCTSTAAMLDGSSNGGRPRTSRQQKQLKRPGLSGGSNL